MSLSFILVKVANVQSVFSFSPGEYLVPKVAVANIYGPFFCPHSETENKF